MATPLRSVPLPERTSQYVRVLWARATQPVKFVSYNRSVCGRYMHWGDKHSELCRKPEIDCPHCKARYVRLWYGWLFGRNDATGEPALLQLTASAVRTNVSLRDGGCDLRGAKITLERHADQTGSTVFARVTLAREPEKYPDEEPDTIGHLLNFYKLTVFRDARDRGQSGGEQ